MTTKNQADAPLPSLVTTKKAKDDAALPSPVTPGTAKRIVILLRVRASDSQPMRNCAHLTGID